MSNYQFEKILALGLILSLAALCGGCLWIGNGVSSASESVRQRLGSSSWAYGAKLGRGVLCSVEERTRANGRLIAKFSDSKPCWTASFEEPLSGGGKVCCQIILPNDWNGTLWVVGNDLPDGELPQRAVGLAADGSAVVCCDGGMAQVRRGNGRINALAAGARSPALRKAFFQEALALALEGGKILATRKYGREPEKICCYGRRSGGAQALFLVAQDPSAVGRLVLVNPALDFTACAAYDFNVARQLGESSSHSGLLRPMQFANLQRAAKDLGLKSFGQVKSNELWEAAGKYDDSFSYHPVLAQRICAAWRQLLEPVSISVTNRNVAIPAVRLDMDFEPRMRERSWRMAWLFGEDESGADAAADDFVAHLPEMADYTPPTDLAPYFAAGGEAELTLESDDAYVPMEVAEPLAAVIQDTRRVKSALK